MRREKRSKWRVRSKENGRSRKRKTQRKEEVRSGQRNSQGKEEGRSGKRKPQKKEEKDDENIVIKTKQNKNTVVIKLTLTMQPARKLMASKRERDSKD